MRLRGLLPLALTAATLAAAAGCAADETPAGSGEEIVVGASLELSGPTASIGTAYQKALELKAAQLNQSGTLGGRRIKLVVRDNRTDNNTSVTNVNALIKNEKADALIVGACSACGLAAVPAITENKVPAIALASASALTTPVAERAYVFKISPNPAQDADVIVAELKRKNVGRVGLISVNNVYGQDGQSSVTEAAGKAGIRIVAAEQFGQADTSMTVQVSKVLAGKPEAVVVWAVSPAAGTVVKALRDARYPGPIYLDAGAGAELFIKGAGAAAEGTNMVFPKVLATEDIDTGTPAGKARKAWVEDYRKANGDYSGFASFAADALQSIADAVGRAGGDANGPKLRDELEKGQFDGVSGPLRFSAEEHSGLQPAALGILTVKQGRWTLAD
ncbi:ABC transporter substrate-binding protein [Paractinoplanes brasiliensis]|uniref:Amino acid/amide ABC transporter substrate-binding protein (HAAT family) n=1 Tax=Paractinoplanes brasiliensis TaxID=52695 RepID=A0A4V3C7F3_9ACTN|nr:ABC transporter substrate-binding protein [Actinoplanes brasiliensis]TDO37108.1 amino acid/amide ABC transporter substrate-binding protein (HAAT family) [Actinoplanes brasiliensis]GID32198.1 branched-chain amino acid ABC transporter [Actinoplanes brasiliensis]